MRFAVWLALGCAAVTTTAWVPARAQEPKQAPALTVNSLADVYAALPPEGAKNWDSGPLVDAIGKSTHVFTPNDYYEVLDKRLLPEIVKVMAAKAAVFYDPNAQPLDEIAAKARLGQTKTTIQVGASNFVEVLEFFNDVKNDLAAAETRVGPATPQGKTESQNAYERRIRTRIEALAKAKGPVEGRVESTTFQVELPATPTELDGCKRSVAQFDASALPFELFRTTFGTTATNAIVDTKGSTTIEAARFTLENPRRFEVVGRCGTTGAKLRMTLNRTYDGKWRGQGGF